MLDLVPSLKVSLVSILSTERTASTAPRVLWRLIALAVLSALSVATALRTIWLAFGFWRPIPYWDAWNMMRRLPDIYGGLYGLGDLLAFENEHRIATTKLLMLADIHYFDGTGLLTTTLCMVFLVAFGLLMAVVATRGSGAWVVVPLILGLLLSTADSDNFSSGFQVSFPLVDLLAIISVGLFVLASPQRRGAYKLIVLALAMNAVAVLTLASGVTILAPIAFVAVVLRTNPVKTSVFMLPAALMSGVYFIGYPGAVEHSSYQPLGLIHFALNYLGSMMRGYPSTPLYVGTGLCIVYLAILGLMARDWLRRRPLDPVVVWLTAVAAWLVIGAVITAVGRLSLGLEASIASRYAMQSLTFAACLVLALWRILGRPNELSTARVLVSVAAVTAALTSTFAASPLREWREHVADFDAAGDALAIGAMPDAVLSPMFPAPPLLAPAISLMKEHRLGPFSERYGSAFRPAINTLAGRAVNALAPCQGDIDLQTSIDGHYVLLEGWIADPVSHSGGGQVLAIDANGLLLGFASATLPRPDVGEALNVDGSWFGYRMAVMSDASQTSPLRGSVIVLVPAKPERPCQLPIESTP